MTSSSVGAPARVLGWDVLRGLCALGVAAYHLLGWQDVAHLYAVGSYGVYLFFVLSGASLAYTYTGRLRTAGDVGRFLVARWVRLAPLFAVACLATIAMYSARNGEWLAHIPQRLAMNLSFAFGALDPTINSMPIGGWSLGIEAVYYLAFPLLLWIAGRAGLAALAFAALAAWQASWIARTVGGPQGHDIHGYHQVPAFVAYFFAGCVIGVRRRRSAWQLPWGGAMCAWLATAVLFISTPARDQAEVLLGARGALLATICILVAWASGHARVPAYAEPIAKRLGDITYGCYLLHPLLFFSLTWFVLPAAFGEANLALRVLFAIVVLALTCALAAASERWFDAPLRLAAKRGAAGSLRFPHGEVRDRAA